MTKIKRRRPREESLPPEPPAGPGPPRRMQDVMADLGTPRSAGVDHAYAEKALQQYLRAEKGQVRPYCTHINGPYVFDPQYGVYVHSDPKCWKPSKAMYEVALRAGMLEELKVQE